MFNDDASHHVITNNSSNGMNSFTLFNDLTYSDDEDTDNWDGGETGERSFSSPDAAEAAALLDDIQTSIFASSQLPMHPLAREDSHVSDEGSYLAYSVSTVPGEEESKLSSYGSLETQPLEYFKQRTNGNAVVFRPSSLGFDTRHHEQGQQYQHQYQQSNNSATTSCYQSASSTRQHYQLYPPTPLPTTIVEESPVTSGTATDVTISPSTIADQNQKPNPEKERITRLLSEEATKKLRRHKRLKRIKKAAEAREAAVQKVRGTEQTTSCNDAIFAFVFMCHLMLVCVSAVVFGPGNLRDKIYGSLEMQGGRYHEDEDYNPFAGLQSDDVIIMYKPTNTADSSEEMTSVEENSPSISHIDYVNVIQLVCITSGYASLCSLLALGFMMMLSKSLLHVTLIFTIVVSTAWALLGWAFSSYRFIPTIGILALTLSFVYTIVVWDRIPFAATNLSVALKGMRSTLDIPFTGICVLMVSFLWTIWWICAFVGVFDFLNDDAELSDGWMAVVVGFFLFSYYWTIQVIKVRLAKGNISTSCSLNSLLMILTLHIAFLAKQHRALPKPPWPESSASGGVTKIHSQCVVMPSEDHFVVT